MVKCLIIHNKHEGCYDFPYFEDESSKMRLTSITINPPKIFMFDSREQAQDFFEEYINDVDVLDIRCKKGNDVVHIDYCTCGIIELDEDENPILFYNKKNQIFLMETGPQVFLPPEEVKNDIKNLNLTNRLIRKCKTLSKEQRKKYIELGKYCEECQPINDSNSSDEDEFDNEIKINEIKINQNAKKNDDIKSHEIKINQNDTKTDINENDMINNTKLYEIINNINSNENTIKINEFINNIKSNNEQEKVSKNDKKEKVSKSDKKEKVSKSDKKEKVSNSDKPKDIN